MSWKDRVNQAAYISPLGVRTVFDFEDVELSFDKNTSIYRFPGKDGASIPCLSTGEYHYPMTAYISGTDYDIFATAFVNSLYQNGNGILEHPIYGIKTVQVMSVNRRDNLVSGANQAVITIDFAESTDSIFPTTLLDTTQFILNQIDLFLGNESTDYAQNETYNDSIEQLNSQSRWSSYLSVINNFLEPVAKSTKQSNEKFKIISKSIENNLSTLVLDPLTLSSQFILLIESACTVGNLSLIFTAYTELFTRIINLTVVDEISNDSRNQVIESTVILMAVIVSLCKSTLFAKYNTKSDALMITALIIDISGRIINIIEEREKLFEGNSLEILLYGDYTTSSNLNNIIQWTCSNLSSISFGLAQERNIILQSDRTIIDLSFELYGTSNDETLDKLINTNLLHDDEILLIPRGREIVYYV